MNLSLISIMQDSPDFGKRFSKKLEEVKKDKQNLLNIADEYGSKYRDEILEGTEKKAKLLTEGRSRGLTEDQVMSEYGRFVPTVYTPILNFLYFTLRETEKIDSRKYQSRDAINEALLRAKNLSHDDDETELSYDELNTLIDEELTKIQKETVADKKRIEVNKQFSDEERETAKLKDTPEMVEFLYGNITLDQFSTLKKLKALSQSPNEHEAFAAYRKAIELCNEYGLEFDRIPCYVKR